MHLRPIIPIQINGKTVWRRQFGLGDAVAVVAEPVRKALHIPKCGGCQKRHDALNAVVPNLNPLARKLDISAPPVNNPQPSNLSDNADANP